MMRWSIPILAAALGGWIAVSPAAANDLPPLSSGQTVYIPVYSHIVHGNLDRRGEAGQILLSSMLSVRNTDLTQPITLVTVKYYDNDGRVVRSYLNAPIRLPAMGSKDFLVEQKDNAGGAGANFVVTWRADAPVNQPILETVNAYVYGTKGVAFTSRGQAIQVPDGVTP